VHGASATIGQPLAWWTACFLQQTPAGLGHHVLARSAPPLMGAGGSSEWVSLPKADQSTWRALEYGSQCPLSYRLSSGGYFRV
jgi:hypothetical protein